MSGDQDHEADELIMLCARVPYAVYCELIEASAARKARRLEPWTNQSIVTQALEGWLRNEKRRKARPRARSRARA